MASQDDLTLLKEMHQRREISDEQYDVLRRHVLWGTPLPQLIEEVPAPRSAPPPPAPVGPAGRAAGSSGYVPDDPLTAPWRPDTGFVPAQAVGSPPAGRAPAGRRPPPADPSAGYRPSGEPSAGYRSSGEPPGGFPPARGAPGGL